MKGQKVLISADLDKKRLARKERDERRTPQDFYDELYDIFHFQQDLAASRANAKCDTFFSIDDDALSKNWHEIPGWLWLNPPYSALKVFMAKCHQEAQLGANIVALLPVSTETAWFQDYILGKYHVKFFRGRLKFENYSEGAKFPNMLVYFSRWI